MDKKDENSTFQIDSKRYSDLLAYCSTMAIKHQNFCENYKTITASTCATKEAFIVNELSKLCQLQENKSITTDNKFLKFINDNFEETINNNAFINQYLKENPQLWVDFMNTFPLDQYAIAMGDFLIKHKILKGNILELGAGVGNTSLLVYPHIKNFQKYRRTDINILLLRQSKQEEHISFYNFDSPGKWHGQDLVFATNALHCADNKLQSFKHINDMLAEGGHFVICEGSPETAEDRPWALNFACGYFDGWWNKGGFKSLEEWNQIYTESGFRNIKFEKLMAGSHHLGNIVWGQK
jgi:SAM-dependent methyltransferase